MIIAVAFFVSVCSTVVASLLLYRATRRLLEFDDLVDMLAEDVRVNLEYFTRLLSSPVFSNADEVKQLTANIRVIALRLNEYSKRFEEIKGIEGSAN